MTGLCPALMLCVIGAEELLADAPRSLELGSEYTWDEASPCLSMMEGRLEDDGMRVRRGERVWQGKAKGIKKKQVERWISRG